MAETPEETFKKIQLCDFEMPTGPNVTDEISDLIKQLLVREPTSRLGADKI